MNRINRPNQDHASSRYMCVTMGLIDELQRDYFAGRDPGQSVPPAAAGGPCAAAGDTRSPAQAWPQRSVLVRQRQEVQTLPHAGRPAAEVVNHADRVASSFRKEYTPL
jgi:hypothetical protein